MNINWWIVIAVIAMFLLYILIDTFFLKPKRNQKLKHKIVKEIKYGKSHIKLPPVTKNAGIVTILDSTASDGLKDTIMTCESIRSMSSIPITVFYSENEGLSDEESRIFSKFNLSLKSCKDPLLFRAVYESPYQHTIYVAPGFLFVTSPDSILASSGFNATGALFWQSAAHVPDFWTVKKIKWIREFIPFKIDGNPLLTDHVGTFQSDTIIAIDKNRHQKSLKTLGYLLGHWKTVCNEINDADLFWFLMNQCDEAYAFVDSRPGIAGRTFGGTNNQNNNTCGKEIYWDESGRSILGFMGGIPEYGSIISVAGPNSRWSTNGCMSGGIITQNANLDVIINNLNKLLQKVEYESS